VTRGRVAFCSGHVGVQRLVLEGVKEKELTEKEKEKEEEEEKADVSSRAWRVAPGNTTNVPSLGFFYFSFITLSHNGRVIWCISNYNHRHLCMYVMYVYVCPAGKFFVWLVAGVSSLTWPNLVWGWGEAAYL